MDRINRREKEKAKRGKYVYSSKHVRQQEAFQKNPTKPTEKDKRNKHK